jgi:isopentenyl-diphosphate delta-isomerase
MAKVTQTSQRKSDHIRINLDEDVRSHITTGLERYRFPHEALPEIDLDKIKLDTKFLGKKLSSPLLISSMTGGSEEAKELNCRLAESAQEKNIAMALGSQRAAIEDESLAESFQIRAIAPDILLFANLGAIQLNYGYGVEECQRAIDMAQADALYLHLNALQEAVQPEGDTNFSKLLSKIEKLCEKLEVPVIAKEVGWGISPKTTKKLVEAGIAAIDVAGAGGTSWSQVEMHRADTDSQARIAAAFADWGIPTAEAIQEINQAMPDIPIIASGGLRYGVDIAKCIALGAKLGGMASPYLKAANESSEVVVAVIEEINQVMRIAMFASGASSINELASIEMVDSE